jgi:hypothetical protein
VRLYLVGLQAAASLDSLPTQSPGGDGTGVSRYRDAVSATPTPWSGATRSRAPVRGRVKTKHKICASECNDERSWSQLNPTEAALSAIHVNHG